MKYVSFAERQGIEKGKLIGQVRLCQELLKQPQTPQTELLAMPQEDLAALLTPLRRQLLAKAE